jgi:hypothetical protein
MTLRQAGVSDPKAVDVSWADGDRWSKGFVAPDGTVVYRGTDGRADHAAQIMEDGSLRLEAILRTPDAPTAWTYVFGDDMRLAANDDGTVAILRDFGEAAMSYAIAEQPWTVDANGAPVPTHYEVADNRLTQVVEPDTTTAYPIVADPKITTTWWNTTIYFNRSETKSAVTIAGWTAVISGASGLPNVVSAALIVGAASVVAVAQLAYDAGQCLKIVIYGWPPAVWTWAPQNAHTGEADGYCR